MVSDQNSLQVRNPRGRKPQIQTVDDGGCLYCIDGQKSKMMIVLQGIGHLTFQQSFSLWHASAEEKQNLRFELPKKNSQKMTLE
jgi:hypothetical protein